jgi:2',3'-cyclic-nucleotide 2'-phosphodiesterase (5'-nucleotidase family)
MVLLAAQLQPVIDDLIAQGVDKIIVMAHLQQIGFEQALAPLLTGVDIILAAGSNTRLGDADDVPVSFPGHTADFANTYPIVTAGADGAPMLIVNTDNEYTYLGRLVVDFDDNGEIIVGNLAGMVDVNGAVAATDANVAEAWGVTTADLDATAFAEGTRGEEVADITGAVQAVIAAKDGNVFGFTDVYLEGERNIVRNQETNLGNLTADANLAAARDALGPAGVDTLVVSLKNAGGIRAQIGSVAVGSGDKEPPIANPDAGKPEGGVSQLDIENALRFDNRLMMFDTDAAGLKAILEHGVASLGNQGRFPQIGGIRFAYDPDLPAGSRVTSIAVVDGDGVVLSRLVEDGVVRSDAPATISVVTLNFLANGGDGYPVKANGANFRYLLDDGTTGPALDETLDFTAAANVPADALGEQRALQDFLQENHATPDTAYGDADTDAEGDTRIQDLNERDDMVFAGIVDEGARGDDRIDGTSGDDTLGGNTGIDTLAGGDGDDTYQGVARGDRVVERAGRGTDTIESASDVDLTTNVENATLTGGRDVDVTGNALDNVIVGNDGDNDLSGRGGNDTIDGGDGDDTIRGGDGDDEIIGGTVAERLSGGEGADRFIWNAADEGGDRIRGFVAGTDTLVFDLGGFGLSAAPAVVFGTAAATDAATFFYDAATGVLGFDADGTGAGAAVEIATLQGRPTLTAADILFI